MEMDMIALEQHVNVHGVEGILECLLTICAEKEEHVLCNWQDKILAGEWATAYTILSLAAEKIGQLSIPH